MGNKLSVAHIILSTFSDLRMLILVITKYISGMFVVVPYTGGYYYSQIPKNTYKSIAFYSTTKLIAMDCTYISEF